MKILSEEHIESIGILKPDALGDLILALPAIRSIRRHFSNAQIELFVHPDRLGFAKTLVDVDRAVPLVTPWLGRKRSMFGLGLVADLGSTVRTANKIRSYHYDLFVNLRPDMRDALLTCLSGARRRLSFDYHGMSQMLTDPIVDPGPEMHEARRLLFLLENVGIFSDEEVPDLPRDEAAAKAVKSRLSGLGVKGRYIVMHAISPVPAKNWPADRFVEAAQELGKRGRRVLWVGTSGQSEAVARMADAAPGSVNLAGETSVAELIELLAGAAMFIGVDSGPAHIAGPLGVPTLVVFSGTNLSSHWRPLGPRVKVLEHKVPCAPCAGRCTEPELRCLTGISSRQVIDAALSMSGDKRRR